MAKVHKNKSMYIGVTINKRGTFVSQPTVNHKQQYCGTFDDEKSAAQAQDVFLLDFYNKSSEEGKTRLRNKFNFPPESYDAQTIAKFKITKKSAYIGVKTLKNGYSSYLKLEGKKKKNCGIFSTELEAAHAHDKALLKVWEQLNIQEKEKLSHEFNFPPESYIFNIISDDANIVTASTYKNTHSVSQGQFAAVFIYRNKSHTLGIFDDELSAAQAADAALYKRWQVCSEKDRAVLNSRFNFPPEFYDMETLGKYKNSTEKIQHLFLHEADIDELNWHSQASADNNKIANLSQQKQRKNYSGVSYIRNAYRARYRRNRKQVWLGTFRDPISAAQAYDVGMIDWLEESPTHLASSVKFNFDPLSYDEPTKEKYRNIRNKGKLVNNAIHPLREAAAIEEDQNSVFSALNEHNLDILDDGFDISNITDILGNKTDVTSPIQRSDLCPIPNAEEFDELLDPCLFKLDLPIVIEKDNPNAENGNILSESSPKIDACSYITHSQQVIFRQQPPSNGWGELDALFEETPQQKSNQHFEENTHKRVRL